MAKQFMVGTVDDKPLQIVALNGITYFVDPDTHEVFLDEKNLPRVTDEATITAVLAAA